MISDYLSTVESDFLSFIKYLPQSSIGRNIKIFQNKSVDLEEADIAFIALNEYRGSVETNNKSKKINSNRLRKEFYSLYLGDWNVNLLDCGDVINGHEITDTYHAVQYISEILISKNVIPFFFGGSQDLTFSLYKSYCNKNVEINLTSVDNKFDLGKIQKSFNDTSFVSKVIMEDNNELNHFVNIGYQTFLNSQEEIDLLEKLQFESYRLGIIEREMDIVEPSIRNSNIISVDFKCVKASELNFVHNYTNGLMSNQICQISRYAGLSSRVSSFAVFDVFDNKISHSLLSQLMWYFVEGFSLRVSENPNNKDFKGSSYHVSVDDQDFKFMESELSQKWWVEIPNNNFNKKSLIPCSKKDYSDACNQKLSERILLSLKRNFV